MFFPVAPIRTRILSGHVSQLLSWKAPSVSMGGLGACGGDGTQWAMWPELVGFKHGLCLSGSLCPPVPKPQSSVYERRLESEGPCQATISALAVVLPAALGPHASAPAALGGETADSKGGGPGTLMRSVFTQAGPIKCLKRN